MSYTQKYGYNYRPTYDDDDSTNWSYVVTGALFVAAGAYLIFRGVNQEDSDSGIYAPAAQGRNRSRGQGIEVRESIVVDKPAAELYSFWRKLENLPRIMSHLESVTEMGRRSHWKAKAPLGMSAEWDASITEDRPNELIAWRSDENSQVPNEGSVRFSGAGAKSVHNPYTIVSVSLTYHPPLGPVGAAVAKLFGQEPSQQIKDDLQKFKQAVESGSLSLR